MSKPLKLSGAAYKRLNASRVKILTKYAVSAHEICKESKQKVGRLMMRKVATSVVLAQLCPPKIFTRAPLW